MLRFLTAGESHGSALTVILEGLPAGLKVSLPEINRELHRRQQGYGRGARMQIEKDQVVVTAGLRHGQTLGSPLALMVFNKDWESWRVAMDPQAKRGPVPAVTKPRPGHADLAGALKYDRTDIRDILERASARESAARVAAGAVAKLFLSQFGVGIGSWVESIGRARMADVSAPPQRLAAAGERSDVRCPQAKAAQAMRRAITAAGRLGDTVGGVFCVAAWGLPVGLGSHVHWDRRLDTAIAGALMSIPAIKGVEIGLGFAAAARLGSEVHDPILRRSGRYARGQNHAGGLEGGISNGEPVLARAAMKPIASLRKPLRSVDLRTRTGVTAGYERSDICAVPAAAVVGEAMLALVLANSWLEKFGGDSLEESKSNWRSYQNRIARR
jgi:chorismate synthase